MSFRFLYPVLIIFLCQEVLSQEPLLIKGRIIDKSTGSPISDVNIKLRDYPFGTTSSKEGKFSILVRELPVVLEISYIGYQNLTLEISKPVKKELTLFLQIATKELEGVVISDSKIETVYKDNVYSVLDYEFLDDNILLLVYKNSFSNDLILLNTMNDTVAKLNANRFKPKSLFKDCLGYTHVLCTDTAYQVNYQDGRIDLLYPTPTDTFVKLFYPCVACIGDKLYVRYFLYNALIVEYAYVKKEEKKLHLLRLIADSVKTDLVYSNPYIQGLLNFGGNGYLENRVLNMSGNVAMEDQIEMISDLRHDEYEAHYLKSIILTPVYAPLLKLHDTIAIFNHPSDRIELYSSSDRLLANVQIDYHKDRAWVKEILKDEATDQAYCMFLHNGEYEVRKLDVQSGNIVKSTRIFFPFAKAIKIRNGYVYYIYKQAGGWGNSKLFRQKLNE